MELYETFINIRKHLAVFKVCLLRKKLEKGKLRLRQEDEFDIECKKVNTSHTLNKFLKHSDDCIGQSDVTFIHSQHHLSFLFLVGFSGRKKEIALRL